MPGFPNYVYPVMELCTWRNLGVWVVPGIQEIELLSVGNDVLSDVTSYIFSVWFVQTAQSV